MESISIRSEIEDSQWGLKGVHHKSKRLMAIAELLACPVIYFSNHQKARGIPSFAVKGGSMVHLDFLTPWPESYSDIPLEERHR